MTDSTKRERGPLAVAQQDPSPLAGYTIRRATLDRSCFHWLAVHDGRPLYESLGYLPTNEMRIDFLAIARGEWPAAE